MRLALLVGIGLAGAASANTPPVKRTDSGTPHNPYTLLAGESAATAGEAGAPAATEQSSGCPYSLAPADIDGGGGLATGGPEDDGRLYSLMGSVTWMSDDGQATSDTYSLDTDFWATAGGPLSCMTSTPQRDCNANGIDDECDIAVRFSLDRDNDCTPDECNDCNGNGIRDACDIDCGALDGTCSWGDCGCFYDLDNNGRPDELVCDPQDPGCECESPPLQCDSDCDGDGVPDAVDKPPDDNYIYVNAAAPAGGHGTSWGDAYQDLQEALADPAVGTGMVEIWVAEGVYKPTSNSLRGVSFVLKPCTALYGGFAGGESERDERDFTHRPTLLSGDIGILDDDSDNSYHVVTTQYEPRADSSTVLDGFVITGGNADGDSPQKYGGGLFITRAAGPTISNCIFENNAANDGGGGFAQLSGEGPSFTNCLFRNNVAPGGVRGGGGLFALVSVLSLLDCQFIDNTAEKDGGGALVRVDPGTASFTNCVFRGNQAGENGGGLYSSSEDERMINCVFLDNDAINSGGGLHNSYSNLLLHSCTVAGNHAVAGAGGISNDASVLSINNTILWGNTADNIEDVGQQQVSGGAAGIGNSLMQGLPAEADLPFSGNLDADPIFADLAAGDAHLTTGSPAIDQGRYLSLPLDPVLALVGVPELLTFDADGGPRVVGASVDVGAYEFGVTKVDYQSFPGCMSGPEGGPVTPSCRQFDFDGDQDVDVSDYGSLQVIFIGGES